MTSTPGSEPTYGGAPERDAATPAGRPSGGASAAPGSTAGPATPPRTSDTPTTAAQPATTGRDARDRDARDRDSRDRDSRDRDARGRQGATVPAPQEGRVKGEPNTTGWLSVLVAVALLALQIYYALNATTIDTDAGGGARSIITFGSLILGLAGAVLALVGLAQRRSPRWPSTVGLSIGVYAFTIAVFSWIGGLMDSAAA